MKTILPYLLLLCFGLSYSQTTISGSVNDDSGQPLPGANLIVANTSIGTVTDFDGRFTLNVNQSLPFTVQASMVGFETVSITVTRNNQVLNFVLKEGTALDEVVISASRTPERIFESPVTVERFGLKEIRNTASSNFYGGLANLKGVDVNTSSLTFNSVNTRGFATTANTRFMQLVDGMDNSTPALNFPIGNLVGLTETDVLSVELLPGASSALYGANAFNGILFMRSKNPFDHQGISASIKQGITSQEAAGDNPYTDVSIRAAYKFSDKFAGKVNFGYLDGTDWAATSEVDSDRFGGTRATNTNYNGINVYGDEVSTNLRAVIENPDFLAQLPNPALVSLVPLVNVSRTGYNEKFLTDNKAQSIKADWGLYYRPITDSNFEVSYVGKVGTGTTIYQGTNRYNIDRFFQEQHKLEFKNDNYFVRGYVVSDKAGDSYDMVFTGININRSWKPDNVWFGEYTGALINATLGGATQDEAHAIARATADTGRLVPGTAEFENAFNRVIGNPDLASGSKFQDASKYYHADGNYNFSHLIDFADIQVGGSFRQYDLNSFGSIYTDYDGNINYNEFGVYTQIQKDVELNDIMDLKITASARYDKSEFFKGFVSPRLSLGLTLNENHNIRASAQTGFRNPTTQDLFIGLDAGRAILVGSAPDNLDRYSREFEAANGTIYTQTGAAAYNNSYTASSVQQLAATGDPTVLEVANPNLVTPEKVTSVEIGYRGKFSNIIVDFSTYYNSYKDFISSEVVIAPLYGSVTDGSAIPAIATGDFKTYSAYTNSDVNVNSYGASIGLSTKIFGDFDLGGSYTFTKQDFDQAANPNFETNFNTPEHKFKASFGNTELVKNLGFNVSYRFSDDFFWQATFGDGIVPEFHTVDAQINYKIPSLKSVFKIGGTNIGGKEYFTVFGSGFIGSMYYASWTINNL
ncbi:TonB-dependent receptor [Oceanihabitans sp. IOP_32]|uniref:TonB-dependent receptor n=1 Tax=Oceanihabitans sp. IOP_32 TaxID=2529032 RepID=UPI001292E92C|nr:TonB-dependent receptor [Oceanihabitans sp. IOP_32]QFZ54671.1 TonB-dependent receptor [Oceanihabitans sp. IOP_32]